MSRYLWSIETLLNSLYPVQYRDTSCITVPGTVKVVATEFDEVDGDRPLDTPHARTALKRMLGTVNGNPRSVVTQVTDRGMRENSIPLKSKPSARFRELPND